MKNANGEGPQQSCGLPLILLEASQTCPACGAPAGEHERHPSRSPPVIEAERAARLLERSVKSKLALELKAVEDLKFAVANILRGLEEIRVGNVSAKDYSIEVPLGPVPDGTIEVELLNGKAVLRLSRRRSGAFPRQSQSRNGPLASS